MSKNVTTLALALLASSLLYSAEITWSLGNEDGVDFNDIESTNVNWTSIIRRTDWSGEDSETLTIPRQLFFRIKPSK